MDLKELVDEEAIASQEITVVPSPRETALAPEVESIEHKQLRESASFGTKTAAFIDTAIDNNWVKDLYSLGFSKYEEDPEHKIDFATANQMLNDAKLQDTTENIGNLTNTINFDEARDRIDQMQEKQYHSEVSSMVLSQNQIMTASVVGAVATPDVALSMGLGIGFKLNTIRKSLSLTVPMETMAAAGQAMTNTSFTDRDAITQLAIAPLSEAFFIKAFSPREVSSYLNDMPIPTNNQHSDLVLALPFRDQVKGGLRKEGEVIYQEGTQEIAKKAEEIRLKNVELEINNKARNEAKANLEYSEQMKDLQRQKQIEIDKLDEFYGQPKVTGKTRKEADKIALQRTSEARERQLEIKRLEDEYNAEFQKMIEEEEVAIRNQLELDDMIKTFETSPKYEASTVKSVLRNVAKKSKEFAIIAKKSRLASDKIVVIKTEITALGKQIEALNIKIKKGSTKGVMTRWNNQVKKLKDAIKTNKNKLSNNVNANKINQEAKELNRLGRMIGHSTADFEKVANDMQVAFKNMRPEEVAEFKNSVELLSKKYPNEFNKVKTDMANILKPQEEAIKLSTKNLSRKQKTMIIGLGVALGTTSAQAGDDTGDVNWFGTLVGLGVLLYASPKIWEELRGFKGLSKVASESRETMKQSVNHSEFATSKEGGKFYNVVNNTLTSATTRLFDSFMPLAKMGGDIKKLAEDLLFSFEHGKFSAEMAKSNNVKKAQARLAQSYEDNFSEWLKETGVSKISGIVNSLSLRYDFNKQISNALETGIGNPQALKASKEYKKVMDELFESAELAEVFGVKSVKKMSGYFPRLWRTDNVHKYLAMNPANAERIRDALAQGLMNNQKLDMQEALAKADDMISSMTATRISSGAYDDLFGKIDDLLAEGVDESQVAERIAKYADANNRLKGRNDIDMGVFANLKILDGNGVEVTAKLEDFVKRDATAVYQETLSAMYGQIALAEKGFKSHIDILRHIDRVAKHSPEPKRDLEDIVSLVLGKSIHSESQAAVNITNTIADLTIYHKLPMVAFSTSVEIFKTLFARGFRGVGNSFKLGLTNKNDYLVKVLQDEVPLGLSRLINKGDFRGFEMSDASDIVSERGILGKAAHHLKMGTILFSGLSHISDFVQKVNLVSHTEILADFLQTGKGLSASRLKGYGLTQEVAEMLKDKLVMANGNLQTPDFTKWSKVEKDAYVNIMHRMNDEMSLESTIGGAGLWGNRSNAGKLATSLLGYSQQLVTKQGVRDMRNLDSFAALNTGLTVLGAYIGLKARYEASGKAYTEEQLLYYALLNIPITQPYSIVTGIANPATVQVTTDIANMAKTGF